jgi:methylated-DNA-[protein]-cysteine S-methyltransferase
MERYTTVDSPVGTLVLTGDEDALTGCYFADVEGHGDPTVGLERDDAPFAEAAAQLRDYFAGRRRRFDLPLAPRGTEFQRRVWEALRTIDYGETRSYRQIAEQVGAPGASRAVGLANGRNPIAVIVPCHRVIGADGSLTGYGGGMARKRVLLDLEAGVLPLV